MPDRVHVTPSSLKRILDNYELALSDYAAHQDQLSEHWHPFYQNFKERISDPNSWHHFRTSGLTHGLDDSYLHPPNPTHIQEKYNILRSHLGPYIDLVVESTIGTPHVVEIEGRPVSISSLNHGYYAFRLLTETGVDPNQPIRILEIGGGFGGLAYVLKRLFPNLTYVGVDLPEANALSTYYLSQNFQDASISLLSDIRNQDELAKKWADFTLIPPWELKGFPKNCMDWVINTCSMMEMQSKVITKYFNDIHRVIKQGGFFYCVNRYSKKVGDDVICIGDYPFDQQWQVIFSKPKWDSAHIHELLVQRTGEGPTKNSLFDQLATVGKRITNLRNTNINVIEVQKTSKPLILPKPVVMTGDGHPDMVLVYNEGQNKIDVRLVTTKPIDSTQLEILEGVFEGDKVITDLPIC